MSAFLPGAVSPDAELDWLPPNPDGTALNGVEESGPASEVRAEPPPARSAGATAPAESPGTGAGVQTLSG